MQRRIEPQAHSFLSNRCKGVSSEYTLSCRFANGNTGDNAAAQQSICAKGGKAREWLSIHRAERTSAPVTTAVGFSISSPGCLGPFSFWNRSRALFAVADGLTISKGLRRTGFDLRPVLRVASRTHGKRRRFSPET